MEVQGFIKEGNRKEKNTKAEKIHASVLSDLLVNIIDFSNKSCFVYAHHGRKTSYLVSYLNVL